MVNEISNFREKELEEESDQNIDSPSTLSSALAFENILQDDTEPAAWALNEQQDITSDVLPAFEVSDVSSAHPALAEISKLFEDGDGFIVASTLEAECAVYKDGKLDVIATRAKTIAALRKIQEVNDERRSKDATLPQLKLQYFQNGKEVDGKRIDASKLSDYDVKLTRMVNGKPDGVITLAKKEAEFDYDVSLKEQRELLVALAGKRVNRADLINKLAEIKKPYIEAQKIWDALTSKNRPELRDQLLANLAKIKPGELPKVEGAFKERFGTSIRDFVVKNTTPGSDYQKRVLDRLGPLQSPIRKPRK